MGLLRISVWLVLFISVVGVHAAPYGGGHHHTHTIIHVPTRVHTVHHHHVKKVKVPVYVHHKHTHHHHELPSSHEHDAIDDDLGGEEYEEDFNSWHARNDDHQDDEGFDHFDHPDDSLENDFDEDIHHF